MTRSTTIPAVAPIPRLALSFAEAAEALSLSDRSVEELVRAGQLRAVRVGRRVLLPVVELQRWLDKQLEGGGE